MTKYYAVRKGRETGIFDSWASCEAVTKGFSGAEYKSFKTKQAAQDYLQDGNKQKDTAIPQYPCAYIDGSYDASTQRYSYGAIVLTGPDNEQYFSQALNDEGLATMRNVAGEIKASEFAISYAIAQGWSQIAIYFDYYGIEKWATGEWKRNLPATQAYYAFCQDAFKKIDINFIKVKGHSGNKYNDMADSLAREALNL